MLTFVVALVVGFVGSIPAAGPLAWLLASHAASGDRRAAMRLAIGGALAEALWAVAAASSAPRVVASLVRAGPTLDLVLAIVLVALGASTFRARAPREGETGRGRVGGVAIGFSLVALNPAFFLFWLSAWRFLHPRLAVQPSPLPVALGAFAGIVGWFTLLAEVSRRAGARVEAQRLELARRAAAIGMIALGVWMAMSAVGLVARAPLPE